MNRINLAVPLTSFATFGDLLKYLRRRERLTQRELAIAVGYSEAQISRLEQGLRLPDLSVVAAQFVQALRLEREPEIVAHLLQLAAAARGDSPIQAGSLTFAGRPTRLWEPAYAESLDFLSQPPVSNLPLQLTSFIGREHEIVEVRRLLATNRLVTLTGAGGCGKTRLALEVAHSLVDGGRWTMDGGTETPPTTVQCQQSTVPVTLVELTPVLDPALVPLAVAAALGVQAEGGENRMPIAVLVNHLRARNLLLLLDNCEHVVLAAAQLAETLLRACPGLRILATSRELLSIPGEITFRVPSLSLPEQDDLPFVELLSHYEAIRLFVERARAVALGFALSSENAPAVIQVCRRLDGIPLAIELAAARLNVLQVEQIAARLDDAFRLLTAGSRTALPRHQTLRALIDWSYDLLSAAERAALARLSVFAGGWTLAAAEAVVGDGGRWMVDGGTETTSSTVPSHSELVLDHLSRLAAKSLLVVEWQENGEARYKLLETIRQYAHEKLLAAGDYEAARSRHLSFCTRVALEKQLELDDARQADWFAWLDLEHDNLRAAVEWALNSPHEADFARGVDLMGGLEFGLWVRGYNQEKRDWLQRFVAQAHRAARTRSWARLLAQAGLSFEQDHERAAALLAASRDLCAELNDPSTTAFVLSMLGTALWWVDREQARSYYEQSLAIYRRLGDRANIAGTLRALSEFLQVRYEDRPASRAMLEESLALYRELGNKHGMAAALTHLCDVALEQGDMETGERLGKEALALAQELGDKTSIAWSLNGLGNAAWGRGNFEDAIRFDETSLFISREIDDYEQVAIRLHWLATAIRFQGDLDRAAGIHEENLAHSRVNGLSWGVAMSLYGLGEVARARGSLPAAMSFHIASLVALREVDYQWQVTYALQSSAYLAAAAGEAARAVKLLASAEALRQAIGSALFPVERVEHEQTLSRLRATLGDKAFDRAWSEGLATAKEEAIDYALGGT